MSFLQTPLPGVKIYAPAKFADNRGIFLKTFHEGLFAAEGIKFELKEEFFSISAKNVLRGMHFQIPPVSHAKIVTCLAGKILDVVLDLRRGQPTYGTAWSVELSEENGNVLYIPEGLAHGFLSLADNALVHYKASTTHSPEHDRGIRWDGFDFAWPVENPVMSQRDLNFPSLHKFETPFI